MAAIETNEATRLLTTLQGLLEIPVAELQLALTHATDVIADALGADKVDAFLYDEARDSLVAVGTSTQPLSSLQRKLGLDVLPISNGGRVVDVFRTGQVFRTGRLLDDPEELRGVKEGLRIQSKLGVPLEVGGQRRGMMMVASLKPEYFSDADESFARSAVHWVGSVAHRAELVQEIERNAVEQGRSAAADEIVTVLAHDLRNYIAPISSRLYALRHSAEANGRAEDVEHARAALRGVSQLNALVSNLLDVARLDAGLFELDLQPLDLHDLVREAAATLSTTEHKILVKASEPVVISGDPQRIRQCLDNVLANASRHSPAGAAVSVLIGREVRGGRQWGRIEVIDEGPGIPKELLPRLFKRFAAHRSGKSGLGLGLFISRRIAVAHGGDLWVDQAAGKGARFVLDLPLLTYGK